jgi:hypothetical protein
MDYERFEELMEEDIPYKDSISDGVIQGILLMRKYVHGTHIEGADHDVIYSIDIDPLIDAGITEEDVRTLNKMGWHVEDGYMRHFV